MSQELPTVGGGGVRGSGFDLLTHVWSLLEAFISVS